MPEPRGTTYTNTVGNIIKYDALAHYLEQFISNSPSIDCFLDVPCGTGELLASVSRLFPKLKLIGCDISERQIDVSRSKNPHSTLFVKDVFTFFDNESIIRDSSILCHIGFCFFNLFPLEKRTQLIDSIFKTKDVSLFAFEIQNIEHQRKHFVSGLWYKISLNNNLVMLSRSVIIENQKKELELQFWQNNRLIQTSKSILFDWEINNCLAVCKAIGWKNVSSFPAYYRDSGPDMPSHWFICCAKEK